MHTLLADIDTFEHTFFFSASHVLSLQHAYVELDSNIIWKEANVIQHID